MLFVHLLAMVEQVTGFADAFLTIPFPIPCSIAWTCAMFFAQVECNHYHISPVRLCIDWKLVEKSSGNSTSEAAQTFSSASISNFNVRCQSSLHSSLTSVKIESSDHALSYSQVTCKMKLPCI